MLTFGNKVENGGTTPQGILTAEEFNALVRQVNANTGKAAGTVSGVVVEGNVIRPDSNGFVYIDALDDVVEKSRGIEAGAQVNKIDRILINGMEQPVVDKVALLSIPTHTSELVNDSGFIRNEDISRVLVDIQERLAEVEERNTLTDDMIEVIESVEKGAQANKIEAVYVNGTAKPVIKKGVYLDIPTKTSDLENDAGFLDEFPEILDGGEFA